MTKKMTKKETKKIEYKTVTLPNGTTMRFEIVNQHGETVSKHKTFEAAEKAHQKNLAWRCGICGSHRGGWGKCKHGAHQRVCSAEHYNDRVVQVA